MGIIRILLLYCFIGACLAGNELTVRKLYIQNALVCTQEFPVSGEELEMMIRIHKFPKSKNAQCLLACMFKKMDMVDDKGFFDVDGAIKFSIKEYVDDKDKIEAAKKLYGFCGKVNKEPVTDGDKGCERSALLAICLTENYISVSLEPAWKAYYAVEDYIDDNNMGFSKI